MNILKASGKDEQAMTQWHIEFEREMPQAHQDFLESLGIGAQEIDRIRAWIKSINCHCERRVLSHR